jgi:hypothetical protein
MRTHFVITDHALIRFIQRCDSTDDPTWGESRRLLRDELERAVHYFGEIGKAALYFLPCGLTGVVIWDHGMAIVKTVLTHDMIDYITRKKLRQSVKTPTRKAS